MSFEPILLAPQEEAEEIYPYRRVWRTSWLEIGVLMFAVLLIFLLTSLFGVLPADWRAPLPKVAIALLPLLAWLVFSYWGERRALQRRQGLFGLLILGGVLANGIAVPLEEHVYLPDQWLPAAGFFGRVLGYAFTVGFTGAFLQYAAVRYTVWPEHITQRLDGVAYALAVALGYAVSLNLRFALFSDATLLAAALRVASITFSQLAFGVVIGFFLAELVIGRVPVFWIPFGLSLVSVVSGLYYAFRGVAIVGGLSVDSTSASPIRGLMLAFALVAAVYMIFAFLIANADARMEALIGRREAL